MEKEKLKVLIPHGSNLVRHYNKNVIKNLKNRNDGKVEKLSIVSNAKFLTSERRELLVEG